MVLKMYVYYLLARPAMPGTIPKPKDNSVQTIMNFNKKKYCEDIGREAWGYVGYENALADKDVADFELHPAQKYTWQ